MNADLILIWRKNSPINLEFLIQINTLWTEVGLQNWVFRIGFIEWNEQYFSFFFFFFSFYNSVKLRLWLPKKKMASNIEFYIYCKDIKYLILCLLATAYPLGHRPYKWSQVKPRWEPTTYGAVASRLHISGPLFSCWPSPSLVAS